MKNDKNIARQDEVVRLALKAKSAAEQYANQIGLRQNHAEAIAADLFHLIGHPAVEENSTATDGLGTQQQLNVRRLTLTDARRERRAAVAAGLAFCAASIGVLKNYYGNQWNPRWQAAGFTQNSIAVPENPVALLTELRGYFRAHPEHENEKLEVTVARADQLFNDIEQADRAVESARGAHNEARRDRNGAVRQLKRRLTSLRAELGLSLDAEDSRWREFGFRRPSDRRSPKPVETLQLKPGLPGEVSVHWSAATRAESYRLTKQVRGVDHDPVEAGIFTDTATMIRGLPSGSTVVITITARNSAGESTGKEGEIVVP